MRPGLAERHHDVRRARLSLTTLLARLSASGSDFLLVGGLAAEAPVLVRECATLPARTRAEVPVGWNKVKSLFVESEAGAAAAEPSAANALAGLDPALAKYLVPEGEAGLLALGTDAATLSGALDFQGLFDQAGIPNTDEVEALEARLQGARVFFGAVEAAK
jgi:hypothetical protein